MDVHGLDRVLSPEGWPYASSLPMDSADPGRFHALFGRDALITSLQLLPVRPDLARASIRALAARQGRVADPLTGEAPGKIGHEFRDAPPESFTSAGWPRAGPFRYYATADATSWFLVVLEALDDPELAAELEPSWRAAASWLATSLADGDGIVWHRPTSPVGLTQQGWRDTVDPRDPAGGGTLRPDGSVPQPPYADTETQAVTVLALRALARLTGDHLWTERAAHLRQLLSRNFLPEVLMLERGSRPVTGAGSQLGWLLWADAIEDEHVDDVAARLCRSDVLTAHGLRTLAASEPTFAPDAYHRGAVWPFDSWLGWSGLHNAGRHDEAERVRQGVLDAVAQLGGHPELYAVTEADAVRRISVANREQAWTVGAVWALQNRWDGRVGG